MNYCEICKYRFFCKDEIEKGKTKCKDFEIDLSSDKVEAAILHLVVEGQK